MHKKKIFYLIGLAIPIIVLMACNHAIDAGVEYQTDGVQIDGTAALIPVNFNGNYDITGQSDPLGKLLIGEIYKCTVPGWQTCYIIIWGFNENLTHIEVATNTKIYMIWVKLSNLYGTLFREPDKWERGAQPIIIVYPRNSESD